MKSFLYRVHGIPGLEESIDRKLICSSSIVIESDGYLELLSPEEEAERYLNLSPKSVVALRHGLTRQYKYFHTYSYEIENNASTYIDDGETKKLNRLKLSVQPFGFTDSIN